MNRALALPLVFLGCLSGVAAGCAVPASVDGVVHGDGFTLRCTTPLTKPVGSGRDRVVVLAEEDSETLRSVTLRVPDADTLPLGRQVVIGPSRDQSQPSLDVMVGALDIETRSDGVQIISSRDPTISGSTRGTLTVSELSDTEVSGHFRAALDDGGWVEGDFTAFPAD